MAGVTTSFPNSAKTEYPSAAHCLLATATFTANTTNASPTLATVSSLAGLAIGMPISGTGIAAGAVIVAFASGTSITMSANATATGTGVTITAVGDVFKMGLIKSGMAGTYDATTALYSTITGNTDEATGTGYTAGGTALTNVSPALSSGVAVMTFSPNPSWTSATLSVAAAFIQNTIARFANVTGRLIGLFDLGGTQSVTNGTLTLVIPVANNTTGLLRIS